MQSTCLKTAALASYFSPQFEIKPDILYLKWRVLQLRDINLSRTSLIVLLFYRSALRNWLFQVSKDGKNWTTLYTHTDDSSLNEPGSTASWPLEPPEDSQGWRHIRLLQNGKNASGQTHYLSLSGLEIYGTVLEAVEEQIGKTFKWLIHVSSSDKNT